jgi:hypothetical protein
MKLEKIIEECEKLGKIPLIDDFEKDEQVFYLRAKGIVRYIRKMRILNEITENEYLQLMKESIETNFNDILKFAEKEWQVSSELAGWILINGTRDVVKNYSHELNKKDK